MNKRFTLVAGIAILAIAVAVPFLYAQPMHRGHGGPDGFGMLFGHLDKLQQALNLTNDQMTQLQAIGSDLKAQNAPLHDQLRGGFQQIATTLLSNPNDVATAQGLIDQQSATERTMKTNALNAASKALNVLTADQRAQLANMLAKRAARHQQQ